MARSFTCAVVFWVLAWVVPQRLIAAWRLVPIRPSRGVIRTTNQPAQARSGAAPLRRGAVNAPRDQVGAAPSPARAANATTWDVGVSSFFASSESSESESPSGGTTTTTTTTTNVFSSKQKEEDTSGGALASRTLQRAVELYRFAKRTLETAFVLAASKVASDVAATRAATEYAKQKVAADTVLLLEAVQEAKDANLSFSELATLARASTFSNLSPTGSKLLGATSNARDELILGAARSRRRPKRRDALALTNAVSDAVWEAGRLAPGARAISVAKTLAPGALAVAALPAAAAQKLLGTSSDDQDEVPFVLLEEEASSLSSEAVAAGASEEEEPSAFVADSSDQTADVIEVETVSMASSSTTSSSLEEVLAATSSSFSPANDEEVVVNIVDDVEVESLPDAPSLGGLVLRALDVSFVLFEKLAKLTLPGLFASFDRATTRLNDALLDPTYLSDKNGRTTLLDGLQRAPLDAFVRRGDASDDGTFDENNVPRAGAAVV